MKDQEGGKNEEESEKNGKKGDEGNGEKKRKKLRSRQPPGVLALVAQGQGASATV
jgi:hypothetical protein